jgi:hypothetical protein
MRLLDFRLTPHAQIRRIFSWIPKLPIFFGLEHSTLWWSCIARDIDINTRRNSRNSGPISRNNDQISRHNVIYRSWFLETIIYLSHFLRGPNFQILRSSTSPWSEPPELRPWKSQQRMDSVIEAGPWMRGRFSHWQRIAALLFYSGSALSGATSRGIGSMSAQLNSIHSMIGPRRRIFGAGILIGSLNFKMIWRSWLTGNLVRNISLREDSICYTLGAVSKLNELAPSHFDRSKTSWRVKPCTPKNNCPVDKHLVTCFQSGFSKCMFSVYLCDARSH